MAPIASTSLIKNNYNNETLNLINERSPINWIDYPVDLNSSTITVTDFNNLILPILSGTSLSPYQALGSPINQLMENSIIHKFDREYQDVLFQYINDFIIACDKDRLNIPNISNETSNNPIYLAKIGIEQIGGDSVILEGIGAVTGFVVWFLGGWLPIKYMNKRYIQYQGSRYRVEWMQRVKNKEIERLNSIKTQLQANYAKLQADSTQAATHNFQLGIGISTIIF